MKVLLFGATGMVGQGVLRECLADPAVELVQTLGRTATGIKNAKLKEVVHADLFQCEKVADQLTGFYSCFFCLGQTSSGMKEVDYERVTYQLTMAAAEALSRLNPAMTFIYVSGQGTDSSERGSVMWARVKGKTEKALLRLPFAGAYMFRPGIIQPLDGITSRTRLYRLFYAASKPFLPILRWALPNEVLTTRQIGKAMLHVTRSGFPKRVLESRDIRVAAE
jgi:uncharacterized protein YbjT (DUF2867 family)